MVDSRFSYKYVAWYFSADLGECLNDEPDIIMNNEVGMPPGSVYDAQFQCNMEFPGSTVCTVDADRFCKSLMCKTDPKTCMTTGEPPADGTKCGENKVTNIETKVQVCLFFNHEISVVFRIKMYRNRCKT